MDARGLNRGTSGNASVRLGDEVLITPSGVGLDALDAGSMVRMSIDGVPRDAGAVPSSEWPLHTAVLRARADAVAVVHAHPPYATALACARRGIAPLHYMVAVAGGADVRCAPYATFGSDALGEHTVSALEGRQACLLANHGLVAIGPSLDRALWVAEEVEFLARLQLLASAAGGAVLLTEAEIADAAERFRTYGPRRGGPPRGRTNSSI